MRRTLPVGLHHNAEAVPTGQRGIRKHRLDHIETQVQPVRLLGIYVEPHARRLRRLGQLQGARCQDRQHSMALRILVARVKGGQLDRNPGVAPDVHGPGLFREPGDGLGVGAMITLRIRFGPCTFPEHVIRVRVALANQIRTPFHRLVDISTEHKLRSHFAHRLTDSGPDHRLPQPADQPVERSHQSALVAILDDTARQHQRPGRCVHKTRRRLAEMRAPIVRGDLVLDQIIDGLSIRHTKQGFC